MAGSGLQRKDLYTVGQRSEAVPSSRDHEHRRCPEQTRQRYRRRERGRYLAREDDPAPVEQRPHDVCVLPCVHRGTLRARAMPGREGSGNRRLGRNGRWRVLRVLVGQQPDVGVGLQQPIPQTRLPRLCVKVSSTSNVIVPVRLSRVRRRTPTQRQVRGRPGGAFEEVVDRVEAMAVAVVGRDVRLLGVSDPPEGLCPRHKIQASGGNCSFERKGP